MSVELTKTEIAAICFVLGQASVRTKLDPEFKSRFPLLIEVAIGVTNKFTEASIKAGL